MLGHDLAEGRQRSPPIFVRQGLPKLVRIQCGWWDRHCCRRRPPFCDPCMTILLDHYRRKRGAIRPMSTKPTRILPEATNRVEAGYIQWQSDCSFCNHHRGPNLSGIDWKTRKIVRLFHPRLHKWNHHFRWNGPLLIGRTAIGRATVAVLAINHSHRVRHRRQLIAEGVFPPK